MNHIRIKYVGEKRSFFVPSFFAACVKDRPSQEVLFLLSEDGLKNLQLGNTILIDSHVDQLIKPKKTKERFRHTEIREICLIDSK